MPVIVVISCCVLLLFWPVNVFSSYFYCGQHFVFCCLKMTFFQGSDVPPFVSGSFLQVCMVTSLVIYLISFSAYQCKMWYSDYEFYSRPCVIFCC